MEEPERLNLKQLTLKTIMLMALANADRASDLHLLDIRYMKFNHVLLTVLNSVQ